jgi:hypothetical protein
MLSDNMLYDNITETHKIMLSDNMLSNNIMLYDNMSSDNIMLPDNMLSDNNHNMFSYFIFLKTSHTPKNLGFSGITSFGDVWSQRRFYILDIYAKIRILT